MLKHIIATTTALLTLSSLAAEEPTTNGTPFNGSVRDHEGRGLRARVEVVGGDKYTFADGKGRFGLTDIEADDTLRLIYRRDTLNIAVEGRRSLRVVWATEEQRYSAEEDEELANLGYTYVKRRESTEFTSGISGERLRATGCYINGELCLRMPTSINSSSAVLVLCDGAEMRPDAININDVKSVEILKSSNMYGFRGVNGVILITTLSAEDILKGNR